MHDKLVRPLVFVYDRGLPRQEVRREPLRVSLPFQFPARVDDSIARREFRPIVEPLTPVVETPNLVEFFDCLEFGFQIIFKSHLYVMVRGIGRGRFVVDLVADDRWIVFVMFENFATYAFAIKPVSGIGQIGVLAKAIIKILATQASHDDFRMLLI